MAQTWMMPLVRHVESAHGDHWKIEAVLSSRFVVDEHLKVRQSQLHRVPLAVCRGVLVDKPRKDMVVN